MITLRINITNNKVYSSSTEFGVVITLRINITNNTIYVIYCILDDYITK